MLKPKLQFPSIFASKNPLTKEKLKNLQSVLFSLYNHPDSDEFRDPLEYKQRGLTNYKLIVQTPMDISTVRKMLKANLFEYTEECLDFAQTIFENSLLYNQKTEWILALTRKCEAVFHKLVRNHLPEVIFKRDIQGKKLQKNNKQHEKNLQKIEACLTEADSMTGQLNQMVFKQKRAQKQSHSQDNLSRSQSSTKSSQKPDLSNKLFDIIREASAKSLEVLYIMTKNQNMAAISTEKNGNCAIDVKKLSNQFIIKAAAFLKNEIQRAKKLESKEKKKKTKHEATLSRYEI